MSSREIYLKKSLYFIISVCLLENTVGAVACVWWSEDSQRKWALSFHLLRVMGLELRPGQGASARSPRACLPPFQVQACLSRRSHNRPFPGKWEEDLGEPGGGGKGWPSCLERHCHLCLSRARYSHLQSPLDGVPTAYATESHPAVGKNNQSSFTQVVG